MSEFKRLTEWQSERKFILDSWSAINATRPWNSIYLIHGRIFPQKDPYCLSSFLIEIRIPPEYPFKIPEARFLDRIYHPSVDDVGTHCCCWFVRDTYRPTTRLTDLIEQIIDIIDNIDVQSHGNGSVCAEYQLNYDQFYEKALRCILDYGRSRF